MIGCAVDGPSVCASTLADGRNPACLGSSTRFRIERYRWRLLSRLDWSMRSSVKPAYHIPLSPAALRMIGEICAIQGQIEHLMQDCLFLLLDMNLDDVRAILGSTRIGNNIDIWARIVRDKCSDKATLRQVDAVVAETAALAAGRNDFVHAVFARQTTDGWIGFARHRIRKPGRTVGIRTRSGKLTPVSRVRAVRNAASRISLRLLKVHDEALRIRLRAGSDEPLPSWLEKPKRRPRARRTRATPRSERVRGRPPQSSQA
jgi:hypothetical protein